CELARRRLRLPCRDRRGTADGADRRHVLQKTATTCRLAHGLLPVTARDAATRRNRSVPSDCRCRLPDPYGSAISRPSGKKTAVAARPPSIVPHGILITMLVAFSDGKPVPTFPEKAPGASLRRTAHGLGLRPDGPEPDTGCILQASRDHWPGIFC